jgi:hypothetical protein
MEPRVRRPVPLERWTAAGWNTCAGCASLHGTVWPAGKGPMPPLHERCRCLRLPVEIGDLRERRRLERMALRDARRARLITARAIKQFRREQLRGLRGRT